MTPESPTPPPLPLPQVVAASLAVGCMIVLLIIGVYLKRHGTAAVWP